MFAEELYEKDTEKTSVFTLKLYKKKKKKKNKASTLSYTHKVGLKNSELNKSIVFRFQVSIVLLCPEP